MEQFPSRRMSRPPIPLRYFPTIAVIALVATGCPERKTPKVSSPTPPPANTAAETRVVHAQTSYADAIQRVGPGVVTIRVERRVRAPRQHHFFDNPLMRETPAFPGAGPMAQQLQLSLASGVVVNSDGMILTNHHVIDGAEEIKVEFSNHRVFAARVVGSDPPSDLALIKIGAKELATVILGDSDRVRVGDVALAIGNPLGIGQTVTAGIISAKGRSTGLSSGSFEDFLQTDAPINQGNSGGALINTRGELIGINSQILSPTGANIGIGFAIPSNMARTVMEQLVNNGKVRRGHLGVVAQPMTPDLASQFGLPEVKGLVVSSVMPNSVAARAGLRRGDVIIGFNGDPVADGNELRNRVANTAPGSEVRLTIIRDGQQQRMQITVGEYQPQSPTG